MRSFTHLPRLLAIIVIACLASFTALAQSKDIRTAVQTRHFIFKAQSAQPNRGRNIQLTSSYDLKVKNDSLIVYLPYYGRAYSAPVGSAGGGIDFTSTSFNYTVKDKKKGGWDISIKLKDQQDVREITLSVSSNGYATAYITSTNRDFISFYGYVSAL